MDTIPSEDPLSDIERVVEKLEQSHCLGKILDDRSLKLVDVNCVDPVINAEGGKEKQYGNIAPERSAASENCSPLKDRSENRSNFSKFFDKFAENRLQMQLSGQDHTRSKPRKKNPNTKRRVSEPEAKHIQGQRKNSVGCSPLGKELRGSSNENKRYSGDLRLQRSALSSDYNMNDRSGSWDYPSKDCGELRDSIEHSLNESNYAIFDGIGMNQKEKNTNYLATPRDSAKGKSSGIRMKETTATFRPPRDQKMDQKQGKVVMTQVKRVNPIETLASLSKAELILRLEETEDRAREAEKKNNHLRKEMAQMERRQKETTETFKLYIRNLEDSVHNRLGLWENLVSNREKQAEQLCEQINVYEDQIENLQGEKYDAKRRIDLCGTKLLNLITLLDIQLNKIHEETNTLQTTSMNSFLQQHMQSKQYHQQAQEVMHTNITKIRSLFSELELKNHDSNDKLSSIVLELDQLESTLGNQQTTLTTSTQENYPDFNTSSHLNTDFLSENTHKLTIKSQEASNHYQPFQHKGQVSKSMILPQNVHKNHQFSSLRTTSHHPQQDDNDSNIQLTNRCLHPFVALCGDENVLASCTSEITEFRSPVLTAIETNSEELALEVRLDDDDGHDDERQQDVESARLKSKQCATEEATMLTADALSNYLTNVEASEIKVHSGRKEHHQHQQTQQSGDEYISADSLDCNPNDTTLKNGNMIELEMEASQAKRNDYQGRLSSLIGNVLCEDSNRIENLQFGLEVLMKERQTELQNQTEFMGQLKHSLEDFMKTLRESFLVHSDPDALTGRSHGSE